MAEVVLHEPEWLAARRERAASLRDELDLPQFKGTTGWEFTDLGAFDLTRFGAAPADAELVRSGAALRGARGDGASLTQVDGNSRRRRGERRRRDRHAARRRRRASTPSWSSRTSARSSRADDVFVAANDAGWAGGAFVYVPRGVRVEAPILLTAVTAAAGTALQRRVLIVLEEGAEAEVWEQYLSGGRRTARRCSTPSSSSSSGRTPSCATSAARTRTRSRGSSAPSAPRCARRQARLGRASASAPRAATCGWRPSSPARAPRPRSPAPTRRTRASTSTSTPRRSTRAPNTTSDLAFRGILADRSTAVWRGMIKVDPGAQQTDAFQECRNLLLSKRAHADAIPGLEILANDVRCTHAAAIAQIDKEQLFYLRSRGLARAPGAAPGDRGLHGRAGRALRGGPDPRGARRRAVPAPAHAAGLMFEAAGGAPAAHFPAFCGRFAGARWAIH